MTPWDRAILALRLLAIDPGLGGCVVRARVGPARTAFIAQARTLPRRDIRLHPHMTPDQLDDGVDLTATLQSGSVTIKQGLLQAKDAVFTVAMAERCDPYLTTSLAGLLDTTNDTLVIALDEGATEDEVVPQSLSDRLAFHVVLDDVAMADIGQLTDLPKTKKLNRINADPGLAEQIVVLCVKLGIHSLRAAGQTLRCAKALAALDTRDHVIEADVATAATLVLAPRATQIPQPDEDPQEQPEQQNEAESENQQSEEMTTLPDDILLEAVKAALPPGLLEQLQKGTKSAGTGSGSGQKKIGNRRGRPLPARAGQRNPNGRIDMMATLRAAIPWQTMRKRDMPHRTGAIILPSDLQTKRYEDKSDRLLIFTVDASGSSALARLGEAKGAVELLLVDAYARRDHVALIAFRGDNAEVLLPPTRSLVQTKRRLADLPGGGGTPLASGLGAAMELAENAKRKGLTPTIILLTDGRSNVALDGTPSRVQASEDVTMMGQLLASRGFDAMVIDTGKRPERSLKTLAQTLNGPYIAMPRADARALSTAVSASLDH